MKYIQELKDIIKITVPKLLEISSQAAAKKPAPNKWSPKEIIGHLIDSASNNHQRFLRANFQEDFIFVGYQQEDWVKIQNYQQTDWIFLINFWKFYNLHLANVMAEIPENIRLKIHTKHNLHQIGMRTVLPEDSVTLDFFMEDYVFHIKHHLKQIINDK